jgi:hypothetical protein
LPVCALSRSRVSRRRLCEDEGVRFPSFGRDRRACRRHSDTLFRTHGCVIIVVAKGAGQDSRDVRLNAERLKQEGLWNRAESVRDAQPHCPPFELPRMVHLTATNRTYGERIARTIEFRVQNAGPSAPRAPDSGSFQWTLSSTPAHLEASEEMSDADNTWLERC